MTTMSRLDPRLVGSARRPLGLYVLAGLLGLKAVLLLLVLAGAYLPDAGPLRRAIALPLSILEALRDTPIAAGLVIALAVALGVAGLGLLGRRRWGWLVAMIMTGLFLAADIYAFGEGMANHLWMALSVITVFYLNQAEVRAIVGVSVDGPIDPGPDR